MVDFQMTVTSKFRLTSGLRSLLAIYLNSIHRMAEKIKKRRGGRKQLLIETKQAVLDYFSKFDSRDMDFFVFINKHQDQSVFGSRQNDATAEEIRLRKKLNDYKSRLGKDAEFLHLELARNRFHTVSGRLLTLHP